MAATVEFGDLYCDVYLVPRPRSGQLDQEPRLVRYHGVATLSIRPHWRAVEDGSGVVVDQEYRGQTTKITIRSLPAPPHTLAQELATAVLSGEADVRELADLVVDDVARSTHGLPTYEQLRDEVARLKQELETVGRELDAAMVLIEGSGIGENPEALLGEDEQDHPSSLM